MDLLGFCIKQEKAGFALDIFPFSCLLPTIGVGGPVQLKTQESGPDVIYVPIRI